MALLHRIATQILSPKTQLQFTKNIAGLSQTKTMLMRQLFDQETWTYTYLVGDAQTKEALLIDPVFEQAPRDAKLVRDLGLNLKYVLNTHVHADHITGTGRLKKLIPSCQSVLSKAAGGKADILVEAGERIKIGSVELEVRSTPGHTDGCVSYVCHNGEMVFTGDALLIRGCGRTDFQQGCPKRLYNSVHSQIFSLPLHYAVYPAHDYKGVTSSTVEEEKTLNPRLTKSVEEFTQIMNNLNLSYPAKIDISLPANKVCGLYELPEKLAQDLADAKPL